MTTLHFTVRGTPTPQGSKRGVPIKRKGGKIGVALIEAAGDRVKTWRQDVRAAAEATMDSTGWEAPPRGTPLMLTITFWVARPKSHYRSGKYADELRADAPEYPTSVPDLDKLIRAVGDALTSAHVYDDDAAIVRMDPRKLFADRNRHPGATITVETLQV